MSRTRHRLSKAALVAGYLGLTIAVLIAHRTPARGYELSLYAATPSRVWIGLGLALAIGGLVALAATTHTHSWNAAVALVVSAAVTVFAIPIVRGYEFYGSGDSLSHVGWAREIAAGTLDPTNLLYPGVHSLTVAVGEVGGVPLSLANMYVVLVAFPLVFLLFVPLATQLLADTPRAYALGLLAAVLFVPINVVSVHPNAHPASQAILLFAFVVYLALAYTVGTLDADIGGRKVGAASKSSAFPVTGTGVLLASAAVAIVFVHPQQALNAALVLVAVSGVQFLAQRYAGDAPVATHRPLYAHAAIVIAAFLAWAPRFDRVQSAFQSTLESVLQRGPTTDVVAQKSASLTVVGGSLAEIFLKLFGTAVVLSVFAAGLLFVATRYYRRDDANMLVAYIAAGLVPLVAVFLVVLGANAGDMYFRYQGFMMVPMTVVGAAALARATVWLTDAGWQRSGAVLAVLLLVLMPAGLAVVHPSPYVYQPSRHVTEAQIDGYGAAFEHRDSDVPFAGVRGGPRRYVDYHYGTEYARNDLGFPGYRGEVPPAVFNGGNYTEAFDGPRYVATTESGRQKEVELYDGFRYSERGYRQLETEPGVNRVRASDQFRLYLVDGDSA